MVFLTRWEECDLHEAETLPSKGQPSKYLLFDDKNGFGQPIMDMFCSKGQNCIRVAPGDLFEQKSDKEYIVRPESIEDISYILGHVLLQDKSGPLQIIYCRGSKDRAAQGLNADDLEQAEQGVVQGLLTVIQALQSRNWTAQAKIWLITEQTQPAYNQDPFIDPISAPLWGLGRTLAMEYPEMWGGLIDLESNPTDKAYTALVDQIAGQSPNDQMAISQNGRLYAARLIPSRKRQKGQEQGALSIPVCSRQEGYFLDTGNKGTLDELNFQKRARRDPKTDEVEVKVYASGLNFRDVLNVLGQYPGQAGNMGYEATGFVTRTGQNVKAFQPGDRVIVMDAPGCICDYITCGLNNLVKVPYGLSLYEAITLPATFLTAYYALIKLGQVKAGDKVLIHAGAGGVGLAAVQLSLDAGAEVFATAGSEEKQALLKEVGVHHVMHSRTLDFADQIHFETKGYGVDVILNSLSGQFIEQSLSVLAKNGRFLEMGKIGIWSQDQVLAKDPSYSYYPFDLSLVSRENPGYIKELFNELVPKFEAKQLRPLPYSVFPIRRAKDAFRYMAQAKHTGKIVLSRMDDIRGEERQENGLIRAEATYLITGGLGALGLQTARWLVGEGARHIVLTSRRKPDQESQTAIQSLREQGAEVVALPADVAREEDVKRVVRQIQADMPPLKGIIHAAGVLQDGMLSDQTWHRFQTVMAAKAFGAWNLHQMTKSAVLDFFVMYSSIASVLGNLGQSNYAAANAFMDSLAHARRQQCLPALSINWGPWAEVGMASGVSKQRFTGQGIADIELDRGMQVLKDLLAKDLTQPCVLEINWEQYAKSRDMDRVQGFFSYLIGRRQSNPEKSSTKEDHSSILDELQVCPASQRKHVLLDFLRQTALEVLGYSDSEQIETNEPLINQGFDSLMSVEMRNKLGKSLNQTLPASLLFDYPTLEKVAGYLLENIITIDDGEESMGDDQFVAKYTSDDLLDEIDNLVES